MLPGNGAPSIPDRNQPCWYCTHYRGPAWGIADYADCGRDLPASASVNAQAANGCAFWSREPGVDDDGWRPLKDRRAELAAIEAERVRQAAAGRLAKAPRRRHWWEEPPRPRVPQREPEPVLLYRPPANLRLFDDFDE